MLTSCHVPVQPKGHLLGAGWGCVWLQEKTAGQRVKRLWLSCPQNPWCLQAWHWQASLALQEPPIMGSREEREQSEDSGHLRGTRWSRPHSSSCEWSTGRPVREPSFCGQRTCVSQCPVTRTLEGDPFRTLKHPDKLLRTP